MSTEYLLKVARETVTPTLEYHSDNGHEIYDYLELSARNGTATLAFHTSIVQILFDNYVKSGFIHGSLLGISAIENSHEMSQSMGIKSKKGRDHDYRNDYHPHFLSCR